MPGVLTKEKTRREREDSLEPILEYLERTDEMSDGNFDPYREVILEEPDPEEVTKSPSLFKNLYHYLFK